MTTAPTNRGIGSQQQAAVGVALLEHIATGDPRSVTVTFNGSSMCG